MFNSSWCWQKLLCSRATTSLCFCSKRYVIVPIPDAKLQDALAFKGAKQRGKVRE